MPGLRVNAYGQLSTFLRRTEAALLHLRALLGVYHMPANEAGIAGVRIMEKKSSQQQKKQQQQGGENRQAGQQDRSGGKQDQKKQQR